MTKYTEDSSNFGANGPFFRIIQEGLREFADGEDYFDLLADDVVIEYVISVPGYPRRVEGRQAVIDLYGDYDSYMNVRSADNLRVYRDPHSRSLSSSMRCTARQSRRVARTTIVSSLSSRSTIAR